MYNTIIKKDLNCIQLSFREGKETQSSTRDDAMLLKSFAEKAAGQIDVQARKHTPMIDGSELLPEIIPYLPNETNLNTEIERIYGNSPPSTYDDSNYTIFQEPDAQQHDTEKHLQAQIRPRTVSYSRGENCGQNLRTKSNGKESTTSPTLVQHSLTINNVKQNTQFRTISRKKFSWKHYPPLEKFLIANREEYLRHSTLNYTIQQKKYNNMLTQQMIKLASQHGLIFGHEEFSFVTIRDRIRCYYKSYVQSLKKKGIVCGYAAKKAGLLSKEDIDRYTKSKIFVPGIY